MVELCKREICCGCGACADVCKANAIRIHPDKNGFSYPTIDAHLCVDCGLCVKICPELNKTYKEKALEATCYVGQLENSVDLELSQSGGAFWALASYTILQGGVVYGCAYNEHFVAAHIRAETLEECNRMRGSKYVQSDTIGIFKLLKKDLDADKFVLFSGTPCQCAGLQSFLSRTYKNLIVCDIICHGVTSPLLTKKYIDEIERREHSEVRQLNYRFYDGCETVWGSHSSRSIMQNGEKVSDRVLADMYYSHAFFRDSCFRCPFGSRIVSDITIADAWGVQQFCPQMSQTNMGVSEMLIYQTTHKEKIQNILHQKMVLYGVSYTEIAKYQPHLTAPVHAVKSRAKAWKRVHKYGVMRSHLIMKWRSRMGYFIRKAVGKS